MSKRIVVGISGATGAVFGIRTLEILRQAKDVEVHLILTESGKLTIQEETDYNIGEVTGLADFSYSLDDIGACISSGSFQSEGMIIAPCSIKSMSMISNSMNANLLVRAADVTLKERRNLILLVRETPLHLGHLRLLVNLSETGAIIYPPIPAFYNRPKKIDDIVTHTVARAIEHCGIDTGLIKRWTGMGRRNFSSNGNPKNKLA